MSIVHFETLGCKLNQIESESACKIFSDYGWQISVKPIQSQNSIQEHDLIDTKLCIVNTCTVTAKAEQKCRRTINLLLKKFSYSVVLVTGCYAQVEKNQIEKIDERVVVLPGEKKDFLAELPKMLFNQNFSFDSSAAENAKKIRTLIDDGVKFTKTKFALSTDVFFNHSRSSIKIQDGCGNSCSFCRIHIARGKPVSLASSEVLDRVKNLEDAAQKEVVLTGVNLCQYRSEFPGKTGHFADLLEYLNQNTSNINFRISSLYPQRIDQRFLDVLKDARVRPHFHLSVQSGSDKILDAMNRPYTHDSVLKAVENLRSVFENPFIACDIIAGFPGETDEDFEKTMELCSECNFSWIHAFPFSARPGTPAYSMKNQVPQNIARKRMERLTELADTQKSSYVQSFVGKTVRAIMEKRQDRLSRCVTENFLHAHVQLEEGVFPQDLWDQEINVKILGNSNLSECECECKILH